MSDAAPIVEVGRLVRLWDPVLIAPRGDFYHFPRVLFRTWAGAAGWADQPLCGAWADRWVAVDRVFAELLDRAPCPGCVTHAEAPQLTITDAEISAPEPDPVPGSPTSPKSGTKGSEAK